MTESKHVSLKDVMKKTVAAFGRIPQSLGRISWKDYCPHCGYYCTGKTAFCTKRTPDHRGHNDG